MHADSPKCPVCKSGVDKSSVIPIYGRGRSECDDPRDRVPSDEEVPPRPSGHRAQPAQPPLINPFGGVHHPAFGRFNGHRGNYENLGHSTFGLFPSWFGFQIGYYHMNEPPREEVQANQDDGFPELVSKVFILLALFIAFIITTF